MLRWILLLIVRTYQAGLSPFLPPSCRYHPSCSAYTIGCIEKFGAARGLWMGCKRILRCHPFFSGGYDPVP